MAYHTTILRQIIEIFPRHEFDALARDYHRGQKFRSLNRWTLFMVIFIGQLSGRKSLRDLVMNVTTQSSNLYHLALKPCSRATLARVNEWPVIRVPPGATFPGAGYVSPPLFSPSVRFNWPYFRRWHPNDAILVTVVH